jgi:diguanylate cyclase
MKPLEVSYVYWLVAVSILSSIIASYVAFNFAERVSSSSGVRSKLCWLLAGAFAMGLGIWSMHYLGMLAVVLPIQVVYQVPIVILSLILAIAASAVALWVVSHERLSRRAVILGSVIMGGAIGAMHYTGMAAMRSHAMHHYSRSIVALSVGVAVVFSWMALQIAFSQRKVTAGKMMSRIGGAILMGSGIAAMHYTAMMAVTFELSDEPYSTRYTVNAKHIDLFALILVVALVLFGALISAYLDRKTNHDLRLANERLAEMHTRLVEREKELNEAVSKLQELSIRDGLTGVYNRRFFNETILAECKRATRGKYPVSLLLLDIDCFKGLNDRHGHLAGDACLRRVAQVLSKTLRRASDVIARYGGEEFAIILPNVGEDNAVKVADILCQAVRDLKIFNEGSTVSEYVTLSVGACGRTADAITSPEEMINAADQALYRAKKDGRDRVFLAA